MYGSQTSHLELATTLNELGQNKRTQGEYEAAMGCVDPYRSLYCCATGGGEEIDFVYLTAAMPGRA